MCENLFMKLYHQTFLIQQIATEWKLCRDVRDTNKSSQSVDNENESEDGFFIEIYDPKGLVSKEKRS